MYKTITAVVAGTAVAAAVIAAPNPAEARCIGCWVGAGSALDEINGLTNEERLTAPRSDEGETLQPITDRPARQGVGLTGKMRCPARSPRRRGRPSTGRPRASRQRRHKVSTCGRQNPISPGLPINGLRPNVH